MYRYKFSENLFTFSILFSLTLSLKIPHSFYQILSGYNMIICLFVSLVYRLCLCIHVIISFAYAQIIMCVLIKRIFLISLAWIMLFLFLLSKKQWNKIKIYTSCFWCLVEPISRCFVRKSNKYLNRHILCNVKRVEWMLVVVVYLLRKVTQWLSNKTPIACTKLPTPKIDHELRKSIISFKI